MLNEFINEIKELQKYKEKYLYAEKDKERMSDLLYEYMMREYKRMSKQKRIEKYEEECCKCCRYREYCNFDFPQNIYQPIQSNNAWIPGRVGCGSFNGHTLNSDMTLDEAYTECLGMSYKDWIRYQENQRKELIEKEEKHKKEIPELTDYWIKEGHKVLSEDKWKLWDECVPIRLNDLYEGMELGCCLDIIKRIKEKSIEAGIETMRNQGHSGMSWGLMKSMIKAFCDCGDEFLEQLGD